MSIAISATINVDSGQPQILYTVPANSIFTGNIRLVNRNTIDVKVRIAVTKQATPNSADYIEYDAILPANDVLEDTGIVMTATERFYISTDTSGVSVRVHGFQETI